MEEDDEETHSKKSDDMEKPALDADQVLKLDAEINQAKKHLHELQERYQSATGNRHASSPVRQ